MPPHPAALEPAPADNSNTRPGANRLASLSALLSPRSVAVVGASDTVSKIGGVPLDYLLRLGYSGRVYAVNPKADRVQGLRPFGSLRDIGEPVDMAIVALPAAAASTVLDDAAAAGVQALVMFSSGFAELGEAGFQAQQELAAQAQRAGIRLLGPNCLGFMNLREHVYATFSPALQSGLVDPGSVGLVSQSGAFGAYAYVLARQRGLGLSTWITTGNEADVDFADCLEWMAHDPHTRVIMGYMEGCRDGPRLRQALAAAHAARKPVVMVKVGRTAIGAQAAASHTAALAGDDAVYEAVLSEYGVYRARDIGDFFGVAAAASVAGLPKSRSLGLFTISGGVGVLMADEAEQAGLGLPPMPAAAQAQIRDWVPFAAPNNPVDITGQVTNDSSLIERTASLMLEQGDYAMWLGFMAAAGASSTLWPVLEQSIQRLRAAHPDRLLAISTLLSPERQRTLERMGCLVFAEPAEAVRTLAALSRLAEGQMRALPAVSAPCLSATPASRPSRALTEPEALRLLAAQGLSVVAHRVVMDADDAERAAAELGYPCALKLVSPDITHKSEVGGVALNLRDAAALRDALTHMRTQLTLRAPNARLAGWLVAPMAPSGGVECILGIHRDPVFGPMLMFGLGGIWVETMGEVVLRSAPVSEEVAMDMLRASRAWPLLCGARGRQSVDVAHLAQQMAALSRWAAAQGERLQSLDINPFLALSASQGSGVALDAVVIGHDLETPT